MSVFIDGRFIRIIDTKSVVMTYHRKSVLPSTKIGTEIRFDTTFLFYSLFTTVAKECCITKHENAQPNTILRLLNFAPADVAPYRNISNETSLVISIFLFTFIPRFITCHIIQQDET